MACFFFERLVLLAQQRMRAAPLGVADAEDVALSAFASFCLGVQKQRFRELSDRNCLWRLLVSITLRKLMHMQRDQNRQKRGGDFRQIPQTSSSDGPTEIEQIIARVSQLRRLLLSWLSNTITGCGHSAATNLRVSLNGNSKACTNSEIAAKCGLTARTYRT